MRHFILTILLCIVVNSLEAQLLLPRYYDADSLKLVLAGNPPDTTRITVLLQLAGTYFFKQPDTSQLYAKRALEISRTVKSDKHLLYSLNRAGEAMRQKGNYAGAMEKQLEALDLSRKIGNDHMEANSIGFIGITYLDLESHENAFYNLKNAIDRSEHLSNDGTDLLFLIFLAQTYNEKKQPDSTFYFLGRAKEILRHSSPQFLLRRNERIREITLGDAFRLKRNLDSAAFYYRLALRSTLKYRNFAPNHVSIASGRLASLFMEQNQVDSGLYFARFAYSVLRKTNVYPRILDASSLLAQLHRKTGKLDSALYYQDITIALNDSLYGKDKSNELQLLLLQEQKRHAETLSTEERSKNSQLLIGLVSITGVILIASMLLFRNNRIKQKTNVALQQTLKELRSTQSQLVQSEKMASLGELTAGIAHEIQNPLNFVNNFADVNRELLTEMKAELDQGNLEEAKAIANSVIENEGMITNHGKRADVIVKGMLQHSRSSTGVKEPTDINALTDEYLRLSYHGLRAKDKTFNATLITDYDKTIGTINIIPQDIGRVVLNLINNAFYAVNDREKSQTTGYEPQVIVSTKKSGGQILISVKDNGTGIPDSIKDKIFQPFFTTKPTGQGTGLGLSLAYDIVTKGNGGELNVTTQEGRGSEFIITLPS